MTATQLVFEYVRQNGRPSTAQINAHWRAEGRSGWANNTIVRLLKQGFLKRETVPGERGSHYSISSESDSHLEACLKAINVATTALPREGQLTMVSN